MELQTSVSRLTKGYPGQIAENALAKTRGFVNSLPQQTNVTADAADTATTVTLNSTAYHYAVYDVTITAADNETVVDINDTDYTANAGGATATKAEIASELAAVINAADINYSATAVDDVVTISQDGSYAVYTVGDTTSTNCTVSHATATKTTIMTAITGYINSNETDLTAEMDSATMVLESNEAGTSFTVVGTTNSAIAAVYTNTDVIPYGRFCSRSVEYPDRCHLPNTAVHITNVGKNAGVSVRTHNHENPDGEGYQVNDQVECITQGVVYVEVEEDVDISDDVYVRHTASGAEALGTFRTDADGTDAAQLNNARWLENGSAGDLVKLQINLP